MKGIKENIPTCDITSKICPIRNVVANCGVNNCKIREVTMYEIYEDTTEKTQSGDAI